MDIGVYIYYEVIHHRGYDLIRASACICYEIKYRRGDDLL